GHKFISLPPFAMTLSKCVLAEPAQLPLYREIPCTLIADDNEKLINGAVGTLATIQPESNADRQGGHTLFSRCIHLTFLLYSRVLAQKMVRIPVLGIHIFPR